MRTVATRKPKPLDREALMEYAGRALAARAQSVSELRTRLKRRAEHPEDVEAVIAYLKESGYASDQRFAGSFADWRLENQGLGKARVMRDLMARRVAPAVAKAAVEAAYKDSDEVALVERFLARKYRGKDLAAVMKDPKLLNSAFRKLLTAGFSGGTSIRVLKRYAAEAEQLEEPAED